MSNQDSNLPTHVAFMLNDEKISFEVILRSCVTRTKRFNVGSEFEGDFERFVASGFVAKINGVGIDGRIIYEVKIRPAAVVPAPITKRQTVASLNPDVLAGVPAAEGFVFDHKAGDGAVFYRRLSDNSVLCCLTGFAPFEMEEPVAPTEPRPKPPLTFKLIYRVFLKPDEARVLVSMVTGETTVAVRFKRNRRGEVIGVLSDNKVFDGLCGRDSFKTLGLFVQADLGTIWRINRCAAKMCLFTEFDPRRHQPRVLTLKRKPPEVSDRDHWLRDIAAIAGVPVPEPSAVHCVESSSERGLVEEVPAAPLPSVAASVLDSSGCSEANRIAAEEGEAPAVADTAPTVSIVREVFVSPREAALLLEAFGDPKRKIQKFEKWLGNKSLAWKLCKRGLFRNTGGKSSSASYLPDMAEVARTRFVPYGSQKTERGKKSVRFCAVSGVTALADQWLRDLEAIVATSLLPPLFTSPLPPPREGESAQGAVIEQPSEPTGGSPRVEADAAPASRLAVLSDDDLHLLEANTRSAIREAQGLLEAIEAEHLRRAALALERARKLDELAQRLGKQRATAETLRHQAEEAAAAQAATEAEIAALG